MSQSTSLGVGQYRAGEEHSFICGRMYQRNGTRRGIVFCHGVSQTGRGWGGVPTQSKIRALANAGYPVISADLSIPFYERANWGNSDHISGITAAVAYLRSTFGASSADIGLLGSSMGAQGALAWARANPTEVFAVAGMIPVLNINTNIYSNPFNASSRTGIARAYGKGFTTVAAASNGVNVTTFGGAGTLNVADTSTFPASGTIRLNISGTVDATITYTGKTALTFTGCTTTSGAGVMTTGFIAVESALPSLVANEPVSFGASDLAGLPVRLWTANNDTIAATTAAATAWGGKGSTLTVTDLGAVGHWAESVDAQQVVQFFDDNGGRT